MKRKDYEKPTMHIVKVQQQHYLLAGSESSVGANRNGYTSGGAQTWGDED